MGVFLLNINGIRLYIRTYTSILWSISSESQFTSKLKFCEIMNSRIKSVNLISRCRWTQLTFRVIPQLPPLNGNGFSFVFLMAPASSRNNLSVYSPGGFIKRLQSEILYLK